MEGTRTTLRKPCYTRLFPLSSKATYVMLEQLEDSSLPEIRYGRRRTNNSLMKEGLCQCIHLTNAARVVNIW
jgi:hypothetical protein